MDDADQLEICEDAIGSAQYALELLAWWAACNPYKGLGDDPEALDVLTSGLASVKRYCRCGDWDEENGCYECEEFCGCTGHHEHPHWPNPETRDERIQWFIRNYRASDPDSVGDNPKRFLLIETSVHNGENYLTTHDSPEDAVTYHDTQEYPEEWNVLFLSDLDTGASVEYPNT